jgi:D-glycero-D-manno-heptose 1,7-bisphosphate phosphatase
MTSNYIFLDRDGVINEDSDDFIKSPEEWQAITNSLQAIALLTQNEFKIIVITNQSGLARGLFDLTTLNQIHAKMHDEVIKQGGLITAVYYCPHNSDDNCQCRKPKAGLLLQAAQDFNIDLTQTILIGDSYRDIQAAQAVKAQAYLVKTGKGERTLAKHPDLSVPIFNSLYDAVQFILTQ